MCDKKMDTGKSPNTDIFIVKDKKGWYGREWECRACYMSRPVTALTDRDGFRDKTIKKATVDKEVPEDVMGRGYDPSVEE
jgi:hypothetical protein